jgi:hypothetical protein
MILEDGKQLRLDVVADDLCAGQKTTHISL